MAGTPPPCCFHQMEGRRVRQVATRHGPLLPALSIKSVIKSKCAARKVGSLCLGLCITRTGSLECCAQSKAFEHAS